MGKKFLLTGGSGNNIEEEEMTNVVEDKSGSTISANHISIFR